MRFSLILIGLLFITWLNAQRREIDLEEFAERLFQVQDQDVDYEDIYESLLVFYTSPLNLNKADEEELASLYLLSPVQIQALMSHMDLNGPMLSIYELQAVEHFDLETIRMLLPFVTIEERGAEQLPFFQRLKNEPNKYLLLRYTRALEEKRGYEKGVENGYLGSPDKLYARFRANARDDFSMGFTLEKDDGENQLDFYSYHVMLENQGPISKVLVGDFQMNAGQGLVFGAGFNPGKGAETVNTIKRNTLGIRPYTSVLETGFFRGVAASVPMGMVEVSAFYSSLKQDGNIQNDTLNDAFETYVSSIQSSGLHRTTNEIVSRDQVLETNVGGIVHYRPNRRISVGMTGLSTYFDTPIRRAETPYNFYEFKGTQNILLGAFGSYQFQNLNFFGEAARSNSGGIGAVGGVIASLSSNLDLAVSLRDYARDFHSIYGNAFGEGSRSINERGAYWGLKYTLGRKYSFVAYYDKFSFPWLRFGVDAPSQGSEWLGRFTWKPDRNVTTFIQIREEQKELSVTSDNLSSLELRTNRNYIFNIDYRLNNALSLKTRLQTSTQDFDNAITTGYAIVQDLNYSVGRFDFSGRMALFETDDYDNRQYSFEKDVLYAFSIPAYNGAGVRNYLLVRYSATANLDFWIRWSRFSYQDRNVVGSGLDAIDGNNRTELKWMLRWKL